MLNISQIRENFETQYAMFIFLHLSAAELVLFMSYHGAL